MLSTAPGKPRIVGDHSAYTYEIGTPAVGKSRWNASFVGTIQVSDPDKSKGKKLYTLKRTPSMVIHSYERPRNSALLKKIRDGITLTAEEGWEGAYNAKSELTNIKLTGVNKISGARPLRSQLMRGIHFIHNFQAEMCTRVIKDMPGLCVPTFMLHELKGRKVKRAKKMMLDDIIQGLDEQKGEDDEDGYSVDHIVGFLKANNLPVSLYAVDGWGKIFQGDIREQEEQ